MAARRWPAIVGSAAVSLVLAAAPAHAAPTNSGPPPDAAAAEVTAPAERTDPAASVALDDRFDTVPVDIRPGVGTLANASSDARPSDRVDLGPVTGEQVAVTNAAAWHAAGITGANVRVGVIDYFDVTRFWNTAEHGPTPVAGVTARCFAFGANCTGLYFDGVDDIGDDHGVAVVEIIKDMAPDAQIYIGTAVTLADYRSLIDWFASNGVTVVSRSLSSGYDGPGDGRSALNDIAAYANSIGITWVNSAGNSGLGRYYRHQVRLSGNRVAFGPTGATTFLPFNGCAALSGVRWANDWDLAPADRTDYDIYLWDAPRGNPGAGRVIVTSTADQRAGAVPIEFFANDYCPADPTRALYLEVRWRGGDITGDVLEILDNASGLGGFTQSAYSASVSITDSALAGVLAVGAIDPPASGVLAGYSSQGPTNDGRLAPDISASAGLTSTVYLDGFSGTSASAPVVAGGVALLAAAGLASDPGSLGNLARHLVVDRGPAGPDSQYGAGEFRLPAPPPAAAPLSPSTFQPAAVPQRVLDTRTTSPVGPPPLFGTLDAGEIVDLPLAGVIPTGATAVAVNLTGVALDRPSFVQALPTLGARLGGYSNLNVDAAGQTRSNFAIVPVGQAQTLSLYTTGGGNLVVDLLGAFVPAAESATAGRFIAAPVPERVLDTRSTGALTSGATVGVPWPATIDRAQASALVVTVTGTNATDFGWLQALPADAGGYAGATSTVNLARGTTVANTAIVPAGPGGVSLLTFVLGGGTTDVVVDVIGYITSSAAPASESGHYVPVVPGRAFDSRSSTGDLADGVAISIDANTVAGADVPADATGVVWNIAPLAVQRPGFGRMWGSGAVEPSTSAFNWSAAGEVRATAVISAVTSGTAKVTLNDGPATDGAPLGGLIADAFGYFT